MSPVTAESYAARLAETLPAVRERIERAAGAAGRSPDGVRLVAVTKAHPLEAVRAALDAGLTDLGENRVGELEGKRAEIGADTATWHMIGQIQSRKADRAVAASDLIHSIDRDKLARKVAQAAIAAGRHARVLLQVNTSGEDAKGGFEGDGVVERLHEVAARDGLEVVGLMTMAPFVDDERVLSDAFRRLRELSERLHEVGAPVGSELSMGMTNDLEIAVREGSTIVRIGTALFGERVR